MVRVCDDVCEGGWMPEAAVGAGGGAGLVDGEWLLEQQDLLVQVALCVKTLNPKHYNPNPKPQTINPKP